MSKNREYYKEMNRSEKKIEERIRAKLAKPSNTDIEVLEDKIIQLEEREKELTNEVNRLKGLLNANGIPVQQQGYNISYEWGGFGTGGTGLGGVPPQPTTRFGR